MRPMAPLHQRLPRRDTVLRGSGIFDVPNAFVYGPFLIGLLVGAYATVALSDYNCLSKLRHNYIKLEPDN